MSSSGPAILACLLGPLQFGIALVAMNASSGAVSTSLSLAKNAGGALAIAALFLGMAVGNIWTASFERWSGRYAQTWIGLLYVTGNLLCACTTVHKICWGGTFGGCVAVMLLAGRVVTGIAAGLSTATSPKTMTHVLPSGTPYAIAGCLQMSIVTGIFMGLYFGLPYAFKHLPELHEVWWRIIFIFATVPACLQSLLGLCVRSSFDPPDAECGSCPSETLSISGPEKAGGDAEATNDAAEGALQRSWSSITVAPPSPAKISPSQQLPTAEKLSKKWSLLLIPDNRRFFMLAIGMPVLSQLVGAHTMTIYSTYILEAVGFEEAITGSILLGFCMFVSSVLVAFCLTDFGYRKTVFISFLGLMLSYLGIAVFDAAGRHLEESFAAVILILCFPFFIPGYMMLDIPDVSEASPTQTPSSFYTIGRVLASSVAFLQQLFFPTLCDAIGVTWIFLIFSFFSLVALLYVDMNLFKVQRQERKIMKGTTIEVCSIDGVEFA